jgi:hypothetical protein
MKTSVSNKQYLIDGNKPRQEHRHSWTSCSNTGHSAERSLLMLGLSVAYLGLLLVVVFAFLSGQL